MSDLLSLWGFNKSDNTEKLIAVWARAPMIYNSGDGSWEKAPITLTANLKAEFRTFLDYAFMVNGTDPNYSYNGSVWSTITNLSDSPIGTYIETKDVRIYLGNIKIGGVSYPSRVAFSDLPKNNAITWGLETGSDLAQTASSAVITSIGSLFKTRNIKVGDPFTITNGTNAGEYVVESIDSETQITLTATLTNTASNSSFWVGGNWFDVETDDGDTIKAFGKNSSEILIFKRNSLHRYNPRGQEKRQIKGAVGTTSSRSIVNLGDYTYYYHPSGIYRCDGLSSLLISNAMVDFIDGVTTANQTEVIGWKEKEKIINMYLGDVTLRNGDTVSNCIISFDTTMSCWSARSYPFAIRAATTWLQSNEPNVYVGDDTSHVYKIDVGNDFNGNAIPFNVETKVYFPAGEDKTVNFDRVRVYHENAVSLSLMYKLVYIPTGNPKQWIIDTDWKSMKGYVHGNRCEFEFNKEHRRACGVILRFLESSTMSNVLIEKFTIYNSESARD